MTVVINSVAFLLGAVIGSFLNCVLYRLSVGESFAKGRSYCPHCKHSLAWHDLVPVFSFLWLKGKCRYCRKKVSWQYPVVEIATAVTFLLIFNLKFEIYNQFEIFQYLNLLFLFYIASSLIIIFVYDLKHYLIPDKVLFPAIAITFLYRLFENLNIILLNSNFKFQILNYLLAAAIASAFFLSIYLVSGGKWMGFGDVKLAVLLGLLLGFPNILVALFLAFLLGAIIGIAGMAVKSLGLKSEVPFAPFLISGTFLVMFWGPQLVHWYMSLFLF